MQQQEEASTSNIDFIPTQEKKTQKQTIPAPKQDTLPPKEKSKPMPSNSRQVVVVDDLQKALAACSRLKTQRLLAMDMEGSPLSKGGITSLLQLAVSSMEVYIFDVLGLGQELFSALLLLPILSDPTIIKLCYDCRGDAEALYFNHGVQVHGLYDLQIAYTMLFQPQNDPYLKGLHKAMQAPGIHACGYKVRAKIEAKRRLGADGFQDLLVRPLSPSILEYSVEDVAHLFRMHELWSRFVPDYRLLYATKQRMLGHIYRTPSQILAQKGCMSHLDFYFPCCSGSKFCNVYYARGKKRKQTMTVWHAATPWHEKAVQSFA